MPLLNNWVQIGYTSGQDAFNLPSRDCALVPHERILPWPYNTKFFIDQEFFDHIAPFFSVFRSRTQIYPNRYNTMWTFARLGPSRSLMCGMKFKINLWDQGQHRKLNGVIDGTYNVSCGKSNDFTLGLLDREARLWRKHAKMSGLL